MADLQIVAHATHVPTSSTTTRTLTVPTGVQDGDTIHVFLTKPGGSTAATMTGGTGYTEDVIQGTGLSSYYWHKRNATPADGNVTLTFTTPTAVRCSAFVVVTRGQKPTSAPIVTKSTVTVAKARTLDTATAANRVGYFAFMSITGDLTGLTGFTAAPAMTKLGQVVDTGGGTGSASTGVWWAPAVSSGATYGGNTLTGDNLTNSANTAVWLIGLELQETVAENTVYPSSTVSNTGWSAVGAGTVHAALADSSDATYVETVENPAGSTFTVALGALGAGEITVRTRNSATAATPAITREIAVMQGSTVVATRSIALTTTVTPHSFTLASEELALVTDRTALRVRVTDSAS